MIVIKPPRAIPHYQEGCPRLFLGGSIEMGKADNWQTEAEGKLSDTNFVVLNPRRDDWDSSWEQDINNPHFKNQVTWEMNGIIRSEYVLLYFQPGTISPITLGEFYFCCSKKPTQTIVVCPSGYWRKGNVDVMCSMFAVEREATLDEAIERIL